MPTQANVQSQCSVCGFVGWFHPYRNRSKAQCPRCKSLERHRALYPLIVPYIEQLLQDGGNSVLHFAPHPSLYTALSSLCSNANIDYVTADSDADRYRTLNNFRLVDLNSTPTYYSTKFDLVLAVHVLEHVPNTHHALTHLLSLVKPTGTVIINVPLLSENTAKTLTASADWTEAERSAKLGAHDHEHFFGHDHLVECFHAAGFKAIEPRGLGLRGTFILTHN